MLLLFISMEFEFEPSCWSWVLFFFSAIKLWISVFEERDWASFEWGLEESERERKCEMWMVVVKVVGGERMRQEGKGGFMGGKHRYNGRRRETGKCRWYEGEDRWLACYGPFLIKTKKFAIYFWFLIYNLIIYLQ